MRRLATVAATLVALAGPAAAAAPAATARGTEGPATILAAASLTEVLPQVDDTARASFGGSNQLAQQARHGFPFDVFLSASPQHTQALFAEGLVRKPVAFATNSLVLIVPRRNPARLATVGDLAKRSRLRLVVAGPKVPIGLYTREVLKRQGLLRVLRKTVSLEPDVKGIVGKVALGEADAGFVYATDVRAVASSVRVIRFPRRAQPTVIYEAAVAAQPRDLEAAQAFLIALLGADGRRALRRAGFGLPD
ncbi:MAG TPA: molybdate ABC transporter substrate-binding protein [Gaiella sp.]|uniref:molybdate ABC transporter substrate-binding protein n=1 Tax=Gaiella sp. TaxID=2663207 RepID=UPI002D7FF6A5|nr:molybdate ABC transporter substrate-binding protein [Gaiella sp.]HET9288442.1 molybdate ABC transporter substrate-binding protein [Gaiella sp.]